MAIDFRAALYALSDVVINRPPALRAFDQIYMKLPDILLQAEHVSRRFNGRRVVFMGDGDAVGLTLVHLHNKRVLDHCPEHVEVLDFDERVVNSVNQFARDHDVPKLIHAQLYNVADPLPASHWQSYTAFYTNPPWGSSNHGKSVTAFIDRGIEAVVGEAVGCIVIGDHPKYAWTREIQVCVQKHVLRHGFRVAEALAEFHLYHLPDAPDLTSCSLVVEHQGIEEAPYHSIPLKKDDIKDFYGEQNPLKWQYIRDLTRNGRLQSRDIEFVRLGKG